MSSHDHKSNKEFSVINKGGVSIIKSEKNNMLLEIDICLSCGNYKNLSFYSDELRIQKNKELSEYIEREKTEYQECMQLLEEGIELDDYQRYVISTKIIELPEEDKMPPPSKMVICSCINK